ncbi:zinc finger protein 121-like [Melanotaenia boesemani]|uniref:zinc finger protein 121-like n=1 Tax=Melanotaenia boesemani TaxID=1250792 RepID=UPI001C0586D2|nr:zinc finger protein 121-like [Melanotaenia boesemani]
MRRPRWSVMDKMQAVRSLVADRLAAAAEDICSAVEKLLHTSEMSPEEQRAVVRKRLLEVADEIFRFFETMVGEFEADSSHSNQENECRCRMNTTSKTEMHSHTAEKMQGNKCLDKPTETNSKFIDGKSSKFQTQQEEKGTEMDERCGMTGSRELESNQRGAAQSRNQGLDCHKMLGRTRCIGAAGKRLKKQHKKIAADKNKNTRQRSCRVCGKFFHYKRSFLKHALEHEHSADVCGVCGKYLDSNERLTVHLKTHDEEKCFKYETNDKESEAEMFESKEGESDENWQITEGSDSDYEDKEERKREFSLQKTKSKAQPKKSKDDDDSSHLKYGCKVCGKTFCYRASFLKHVQQEEKQADLCGVCGKHFESEENLRLHLQTYIRTNECEVCGKHFDGHTQLEMHMRTHTGEKPFVCTICGKAYAQNGNLMGHMRVHTGEKPYVCSVCGQTFSFKEYMRSHMRIHTGEKPFLCSVCGKGFRQRGTLKTHMMIHTGESTHQCSICGKKFYKSGALKIHLRSHTGEKPYLCNICGKSFSAGGSLTKHIDVHKGEQKYRGGICEEEFLRKDDLKGHVQTHRDESDQLSRL